MIRCKNLEELIEKSPRSTVWISGDHGAAALLNTPFQKVNIPKEAPEPPTDEPKPKQLKSNPVAEPLPNHLSFFDSPVPEDVTNTIEILESDDSNVVELESSDENEVIKVIFLRKRTITECSDSENPVHDAPTKAKKRPKKKLRSSQDCIVFNISSDENDNPSVDFSLHRSDILASAPSKEKKKKKNKKRATCTPANVGSAQNKSNVEQCFATPKSKAKNKNHKNKSYIVTEKSVPNADVYSSDNNQPIVEVNKNQNSYIVNKKNFPSAQKKSNVEKCFATPKSKAMNKKQKTKSYKTNSNPSETPKSKSNTTSHTNVVTSDSSVSLDKSHEETPTSRTDSQTIGVEDDEADIQENIVMDVALEPLPAERGPGGGTCPAPEVAEEIDLEVSEDTSLQTVGVQRSQQVPLPDISGIRKIDINDRQVEQTVHSRIDNLTDSEDDDDIYHNDLSEGIPFHSLTSRTTHDYTSDDTGLSAQQLATLSAQDVADDRFLHDLAPSTDYFDFQWTGDRKTFTGSREVFTGTPGPTFLVKDMTPVDIFYKMFDDEFLTLLVTETNRYADQTLTRLKQDSSIKKHARALRWEPTNKDEMVAFLAFVILQGLYPKVKEESYFHFDGFGTTFYFARIMSYNRYVLLKRFLHFVDNDHTEDTTKLNKIRPVIDYFNKKFSSLYTPRKEINVDESLLKRHGRLSFSQKIKTKAAQVGVKTYELCESSSGYLWAFRVYTGKKGPNRPKRTQSEDRQDSDRQDSDRQDSDRQDSDSQDSDRQDNDSHNSDRQDNDGQASDRQDNDGQASDRQDSDRQDNDGQDNDRQYSDRQDSDRQDSDRQDSDRQDNDGQASDRQGNDGQDESRLVKNGENEVWPDNATAKIVYDLVEPLLHRGHTLIMDNFYNSPLLARCLKKAKTDVFGTLRLSRKFVPEELKTILRKGDIQQGEVVVSYCSDLSLMLWRDSNLVSMISTYHPLEQVGTTHKHNRIIYKPVIVLDYNKYMGGVDRKDQFLAGQPLERVKSKVWYKKLFRRLFNAALFNCFVLYSSDTTHKMTHRNFRVTLAETLLKVHRQIDLKTELRLMLSGEQRLNSSRRTTTSTVATTSKIGTVEKARPFVKENHFPIPTGSHATRCWICTKAKKPSRTSYKCEECDVNLCILGCFKEYHKPTD